MGRRMMKEKAGWISCHPLGGKSAAFPLQLMEWLYRHDSVARASFALPVPAARVHHVEVRLTIGQEKLGDSSTD